MEFFLWKVDLTDSRSQAVLSDVPEVYTTEGVRFNKGVLIDANLELPLRVTLGPESVGRTLTDNIMTYGAWALLVCDRLKQVFNSLGIDNIQWFPLVVFDELRGTEVDGYWAGNVVGLVDCVDWGEASIDEFEVFFERLWIDELKVMGFQIFRQAGFPHHLLVSEAVRNAVESGGFSGVKLVPANGYADE